MHSSAQHPIHRDDTADGRVLDSATPHRHRHAPLDQDATPQEYWDEFYRSRDQVWSGRVNPVLAEVAAELPPGLALDLGCGEGADAIWLADHGWQVTGVDVSEVALQRARQAATEACVSDRVHLLDADLSQWHPDQEYDLVTAQFLQSPLELPAADILRRAVSAVAPRGTLLIVEHGSVPPWSAFAEEHVDLPGPVDLVMSLNLRDAGDWTLERAERVERLATGPDGDTAVLIDTVVRARRLDTACW